MSPSEYRRPPSVARAVARFALLGLVAVALLGVAVTLVLRGIGRDEAVRDARKQTELAGKAVIEPNLEPGLAGGDPRAFAHLDRIVRARLLGDPVVRVKLWSPQGRIVYSDEPRLVGSVYPLGAEERSVLASGRVEAGLTDLSAPENRFEQPGQKLLEVYLPVRAPGGGTFLYEQYLRYGSVAAGGSKVWHAFLAPLVGALVLLELVLVPLAWSGARRLRRGHREREELLLHAVESSNAERRRIAADLHDGVVQDLAGTSLALAAAADRHAARVPPEVTSALRSGAAGARQSMRRLRSLLVEIYPPNLRSTGLESALGDLLAQAAGRGIETELDVSDDVRLPADREALVFRAAQEAVRNTVEHAAARHLRVALTTGDGGARLRVEDDGRGFSADEAQRRREEGHVGLALLRDLAAQAGGRLEVESAEGSGTRVLLEVPAA